MSNHSSFKAELYHYDSEPGVTTYARRDFYKIWLIYNKGTIKLNEKTISVNGPTIAFLNPLTAYLYEPFEKERKGAWCVFTEEFLMAELIKENLQDLTLFKAEAIHTFPLTEETLIVIDFLFAQIVKNFESTYLLKYQAIKSYICLLIHEGLKMLPAEEQKIQHNAAGRISGSFINLLEQQFPIETPMQPLRLKKPGDFADKLAVHVNHLNAVIREVTGKTTRAVIAERMINESFALLKYSDWSIADIAYSLGFDYPNHFNNFFKKHTGKTPLSLRK